MELNEDTPRVRFLDRQEELRKRVEEYIYQDRPHLAPLFESLLSSGPINYTLINSILNQLIDDRDYWCKRTYELEEQVYDLRKDAEKTTDKLVEENRLLRQRLSEVDTTCAPVYTFSRIAIIKALRRIMPIGLAEAKGLLDLACHRSTTGGGYNWASFRAAWNTTVAKDNPNSPVYLKESEDAR